MVNKHFRFVPQSFLTFTGYYSNLGYLFVFVASLFAKLSASVSAKSAILTVTLTEAATAQPAFNFSLDMPEKLKKQ